MITTSEVLGRGCWNWIGVASVKGKIVKEHYPLVFRSGVRSTHLISGQRYLAAVRCRYHARRLIVSCCLPGTTRPDRGSGKSTLLKSISGLMAPTGGHACLQQRVDRRPGAGKAMPEGPGTGAGRPQYLPDTDGAGKPAARRHDPQGQGRSGRRSGTGSGNLPILRTRYRGVAGHLSGGEQQQLAIARAILQRPSLMMVDEPSLGLAPLVIDQVYESLRQLNASGLTLLVVERSTARILDLASRVYVPRNGHNALEGSASELADGHALEEAYFGYGDRQTAHA
ncbi:ATP-binding cassette domain-containing protein [Mesorhizobium ciceri]